VLAHKSQLRARKTVKLMRFGVATRAHSSGGVPDDELETQARVFRTRIMYSARIGSDTNGAITIGGILRTNTWRSSGSESMGTLLIPMSGGDGLVNIFVKARHPVRRRSSSSCSMSTGALAVPPHSFSFRRRMSHWDLAPAAHHLSSSSVCSYFVVAFASLFGCLPLLGPVLFRISS
jgi:hypothetical protein